MIMHTQGKWFNVCNSGSHPRDIMNDAGDYIADCDGFREGDYMPEDEMLANARLISAAPDMLEVLEHIQSLDIPAISCSLSDKINYAINKAKGVRQ